MAADVELSVNVSSSGVTSAIAALEKLQDAEKNSANGIATLSKASQTYSDALAKQASAAQKSGAALKGYADYTTSVEKGSSSLQVQLNALNEEYSRITAGLVGATAAERLFAGGGEEVAQQVIALTEALKANIISDYGTVERDRAEADLAAGRAADAAAAATLRLNEALASKASASLGLTRAQEDLAGQAAGITAIEKAEINLTRATEDLAAAENARKATPIGVNDATQVEKRTAAMEQELVATRALITAQDQLARAQEATVTTKASTVGTGESNGNAFQSSFSYLIIAGAANKASQAILGVEEAAITASSQIERSFADVDRTFDGTQKQLTDLESTLYDLSTIDPISVTDLATIASLGNQLGIAQQNIASFTTTIAQYSTISGQSAEDSATAFGKIAALTGLSAAQYSNLGSAIEYVARTSVATESTIQNTATEITAIAAGAGFSADAIVGLSGALSSLSIPPERARGALSLYFGALNNAIAQGGPKLEAFATITGLTTQKLSDLVKTNQGQTVFTDFLKGLSNLNSVAKTTALDSLGLSTIRVDQTMRALSQNVPLVTSALAGSATAFNRNTELARQYQIIQKTLASTWKEFQDAVQNASAGLGDIFNTKTILDFLGFLKEVIVNFRGFTESPYGKVILGIAGAMAAVLAVALGLVGGLAAVTAGMKLIPWALTGLGAADAQKGLFQFLAGLVGVNLTATETNGVLKANAVSFNTVNAAASGAALKIELLNVALAEGSITDVEYAAEMALVDASLIATGEASVAATAGLTAMKVALITTGVGAAAVLIGTLVAALLSASKAGETAAQSAKDFFGTEVDLSSAFKKDTDTYNKSGVAIAQIGTSITSSKKSADTWVGSLQKATGAQVALGSGTSKTTKDVNDQTEAYGKQTQAVLASSLANSKAFQSLFKDTAANAALAKQGFNATDFASAILKNPEKGGKEYANALAGSISSNLNLSAPLIKRAFELFDIGESGKDSVVDLTHEGFNLDAQQQKNLTTLHALEPAYKTVFAAADASATVATKGAQAAAAQAAANNALAASALGVGSGFQGAVSDMSALQDAVQSGISKFTDFSTILTTVQGKAKTPLSVNATAFNAGLKTANDNAVNFFNGISQLASQGDTSFAQQLATIGPDAGGVLASSLKLGPEAQQELEANARFAAFLASDEFKKAMKIDSQNNDAAYAQILAGGGSLADVQSFITAQVQGVGDAYEKAWDLNHPNFPLAVDLTAPTTSEIQLFKDQTAGLITVEAKVVPTYDPSKPYADVNKYTNTKTGATIQLPAGLDGKALSASLEFWKTHAGATASQIDAKLNTKSFDEDVAAWVKKHGPISVAVTSIDTKSSVNNPKGGPTKVPASLDTSALSQQLGRWKDQITPQHIPANLNTSNFLSDISTWGRTHTPTVKVKLVPSNGNIFTGSNGSAKGGEFGKTPGHFASGGGYGVTGPGTGTSDSIPAWLSMGEWVTPNDATSFWGTDFMAAISRKMLPTSFLNMLGAAAASGNQGPSHVAHVEVHQHNPVTRDPLKQLRTDSENVANGIWGD